jgi:hypothetical protein
MNLGDGDSTVASIGRLDRERSVENGTVSDLDDAIGGFPVPRSPVRLR